MFFDMSSERYISYLPINTIFCLEISHSTCHICEFESIIEKKNYSEQVKQLRAHVPVSLNIAFPFLKYVLFYFLTLPVAQYFLTGHY